MKHEYSEESSVTSEESNVRSAESSLKLKLILMIFVLFIHLSIRSVLTHILYNARNLVVVASI
jgi:hypothetical protein